MGEGSGRIGVVAIVVVISVITTTAPTTRFGSNLYCAIAVVVVVDVVVQHVFGAGLSLRYRWRNTSRRYRRLIG